MSIYVGPGHSEGVVVRTWDASYLDGCLGSSRLLGDAELTYHEIVSILTYSEFADRLVKDPQVIDSWYRAVNQDPPTLARRALHHYQCIDVLVKGVRLADMYVCSQLTPRFEAYKFL